MSRHQSTAYVLTTSTQRSECVRDLYCPTSTTSLALGIDFQTGGSINRRILSLLLGGEDRLLRSVVGLLPGAQGAWPSQSFFWKLAWWRAKRDAWRRDFPRRMLERVSATTGCWTMPSAKLSQVARICSFLTLACPCQGWTGIRLPASTH